MASPPPYRASSPPNGTSLALPRQRPSISLPTGIKSRNPSAVSTPSGLRQASFPPEDSLGAQGRRANQDQYSPVDDDSIGDLSDDGDIRSAISGPSPADDVFANKKRKRGEKRSRGRPPKQSSALFRQGSVSLVNGEDGRSTPGRRGGTAGAGSVANGEGGGDEDDDDEDEAAGRDDGTNKDGFNIDKEELERERERRFLFREAVHAPHQNRYDSFNRVKLKQADVRRLVNATLSQSVPQNVVTVVMAYTKMFAGMLIESAREVQDEWMAAEEERPDGEKSRAFKRLRMMQPEEAEDHHEEEGEAAEKDEDKRSEKSQPQNKNDQQKESELQKESEPQKESDPQKESNAGQDQSMDTAPDQTAPDASAEYNAQGEKAGKPGDQSDDIKKEPEIKQEKDADNETPISAEVKDIQSSIAEQTISNASSKEDRSQENQVNTTPAATQKDTETPATSQKDPETTKESQKDGETSQGSKEDDVTNAANVQPGAGNLARFLDEDDRGPLLPDHFREALRRYRKGRGGGTVGFTGLSLEGKENAAVRLGGKKLFR